MDDREWAAFAAYFEASFRGDLAEDRELALRMHVGEHSLADCRAAVAALVRDGHAMVPAPAEVLDALRSIQRDRARTARARAIEEATGMTVGEKWRRHQELIDRGPAHQRKNRCGGWYEVESDDGRRPMIVTCSECGDTVGVPQRQARERGAAPGEGQPKAEEMPF